MIDSQLKPKNHINYLVFSLALFAVGCKSTPTEPQPTLALTDALLLEQQWQQLERFPPMYPMEAAVAGKEGCATIEYVITPNYKITDISVVAASSPSFAQEAKINVNRWKWSALPQNILSAPVKTQTQFQYCLETGDGHCKSAHLAANNQCYGKDVIYAIGQKMK